jgi:hypothetical protein
VDIPLAISYQLSAISHQPPATSYPPSITFPAAKITDYAYV